MTKIRVIYRDQKEVRPRDQTLRVSAVGGLRADQSRFGPSGAAEQAGGGSDVDLECLMLIHTAYDSVSETLAVTVTDYLGNPIEGATVEIVPCAEE